MNRSAETSSRPIYRISSIRCLRQRQVNEEGGPLPGNSCRVNIDAAGMGAHDPARQGQAHS
jgi:hypothetical protein